MNLKSRLDTLRRQSGAAEGGERSRGELAARLERLGAGRRTTSERRRPAPDCRDIAADLGGEVIANGVIRVRETAALQRRHGGVSIGDALHRDVRFPGLSLPAASQWAFIDTETSGLAGGTGTVAYVVGIARFSGAHLIADRYLMTGFSAEPALLDAVATALAGTRVLVSYNGRSFDVPLLCARYRLARRADPITDRAHLDLLHAVRRLFDGQWGDCRLSSVERALLGWTRPADLPGSEAPAVWFDLVQRGATSRLAAVLRHNLWDLLSLAAMLRPLADAHRVPHRFGARVLPVARAWGRAGDGVRALEILESTPHPEPDALLELARLRRRRGDWEGAVVLWRALAERGCATAREQLAKYHEHVVRDCHGALSWARRLPPGPESAHRIERLERRLEGRDDGQLTLY